MGKKFPKPTPVTMSYLKTILTDPAEKEVYRQTVNWSTKKWWCPKTRILNNKWRTIKHRHLVGSAKSGYKFGLWYLFGRKEAAKVNGLKKWNCEIYRIHKWPYSIFYLVCKRARYSIRGVY